MGGALCDLSPFALIVLEILVAWDTHVPDERQTERRGQNELLKCTSSCAMEESAMRASWLIQLEQNLDSSYSSLAKRSWIMVKTVA